MLDFSVKSSINNYNVKFIDNLISTIKNEFVDTDIILVDKKIKELYQEIFKSIDSHFKIIEIDANENQKSYEGIKPVITNLIGYGFRKPSTYWYRRWYYPGHYSIYFIDII